MGSDGLKEIRGSNRNSPVEARGNESGEALYMKVQMNINIIIRFGLVDWYQRGKMFINVPSSCASILSHMTRT